MRKYISKVITDYDKLSERALEINVFENQAQINDIIHSIRDVLDTDRSIMGLAAPQLGYKIRLFCIRFKDGIKTFINPMITKTEEFNTLNREKDPSIKDMEFLVPRSSKIRVNYQAPSGMALDTVFQGDQAFIFQHLIQLLDGCLISDIGLPVGEVFDAMSEDDKQQLMQEFLESFGQKRENIEKEIDSNEELKQTKQAIEFMTAVATGQVEVEHFNDISKEETTKVEEKPVELPKKRKYTRKKKIEIDKQA